MDDLPPIDPSRNQASVYAFPPSSMDSALIDCWRITQDPDVLEAYFKPDFYENGQLAQWSLEIVTVPGVDARAKSRYYWCEFQGSSQTD